MGFIYMHMPHAVNWMVLLLLTALPGIGDACKGTVYLTMDTGHMGPAEEIARVLHRQQVKVTFFLANEPTLRGDTSLAAGWTEFWRARVAEGHAFGNHTWRHWYFRRDVGPDRVAYVSRSGEVEQLDQTGMCAELQRVNEAFFAMTGRHLDPLWRAPGGRTTPRTLTLARACGYPRHVPWAPAGFLGDELSSEHYPNRVLLERALRNIRAGDILMMHLGIWSRQEPFYPMLEPLIVGLKARGLCFATLME
jgi:peptidoglycan/xylan/chitin deacetylase (PgdA/CDA1 family)